MGTIKETLTHFLAKRSFATKRNQPDINDQGNDGPYNRVEDGVEIAL